VGWREWDTRLNTGADTTRHSIPASHECCLPFRNHATFTGGVDGDGNADLGGTENQMLVEIQ